MDISNLKKPSLNMVFYWMVLGRIRCESSVNLTLTLSTTPAFIKPKIWHIDMISAGQKLQIPDRDVQFDNSMLVQLNESENIQITLSLTSNDNVIAKIEETIELLPRNQWSGIGHMPEMIAAYEPTAQPQTPL
jgi:hypothetical protein